MHGIFSEYYFDLVVAMLLFGLLGVMFVVDEYHVADSQWVSPVVGVKTGGSRVGGPELCV